MMIRELTERQISVFREAEHTFRCGACAFEATVRVRTKGVQLDTVPCGAAHMTTEQYGYDFALGDAERLRERVLIETPCPRCGARHPDAHDPEKERALRDKRSGVAVGIGALVVTVCGSAFLVGPGLLPKEAFNLLLGGAAVAAVALAYVLFKSWRERQPSPLPWWIGHIDPAPSAPPAPPYWTCTRRSVHQVEA